MALNIHVDVNIDDLNQLGTIMTALSDLQAAVAQEDTVIASAITLLNGLKSALDAAITNLPDQQALQALSNDIGAHTQALSSAITTNTPPPPATPPLPSVLTLTANAIQALAIVSSTSTPPTVMPTGSVTFMDGATSLGTTSLDASASATLTFSPTLTQGDHVITAAYGGDLLNSPSTSNSVTVTV